MDYRVKRSRRKTIGIEIDSEGVLVRAPMRATVGEIERVLTEHGSWIQKKLAQRKATEAKAREKGLLSDADIARLTREARDYIPGRVALYAQMLGVKPGRISIRNQKTRWGSCSAKGNLSFNCLLMLAPPEVIDSVVVHELCHMIEMNHSARFYENVLKIYPQYRKHHAWLRKYGPEIMARARRD